MDKQTATERDANAAHEPVDTETISDAETPEEFARQEEPPSQETAGQQGRQPQNGHQPTPSAPQWAEEEDFEVEEQAIREKSDATPVVTDAGDTLEQIRRYAPWVTLAVFAIFPNYLTLGLVVIAVALNGARLAQIVRAMTPEQWGYVALTLLAGGLRFWDLGLKPLHHDESMHAYFSWQLFLNPASYRYDPLLHGPFQFHAIAYVYYIASNLGTPDGGVTDVTARIAAATLGTVMIPACYFLRERIGKAGALIAALLLAVSPIFVYYSRFTREDIYFASFTFLTVVALFKYCEQQRLRWLLIGLGAFTLAYCTKESAFFNIAIFGGLVGGFIAWELGSRFTYPWARVQAEDDVNEEELERGPRLRLPLRISEHAGVLAVLLYLGIAGVAAKLVLNWVQQTSAWLSATDLTGSANQAQVAAARQAEGQATSQNIENTLVNVLLLALVLIAVIVLVAVLWQLFTNPYQPDPNERLERRGLARWVDPIRQPFLNGLARVPWSHWFFGLLVVFVIFAGLFWEVPSNDPSQCNGSVALVQGAICSWSQGFHQGVGDGLVQGIFYWITQQQVARGGQPWYYYLILIPFYEQLIVVFGLGGLIRCLARPNRFRLFVVLWFVAGLFLYSWAGEKMPWLTLHIVLPLLILAAIALDWAVMRALEMLDELVYNRRMGRPALTRPMVRRSAGALLSLVGAFLLLIPMLHTMLFVTYVDPGDAPHEMLSYVQTTTDVTDVMAKINALDEQLYHGTHQLRIGMPNSQALWPFYWYLRDYKNVWWGYDGQNPPAGDLDVIITDPGGETPYVQHTTTDPQGLFLAKQYRIRAWWDEGYKPPSSYGVGFGVWISYGDPPDCGSVSLQNQQTVQTLAQSGAVYCLTTNASGEKVTKCTRSADGNALDCAPAPSFDAGKAFGNFWDWLWTRKAIGPTDGSTDFMFLVRSDLHMQP